jgi:hypothetical protein
MKRQNSLFLVLASISLAVTFILAAIDGRIDNNLTVTQPVTAATVNKTPVGRIILIENDSQITAGKLIYSDDTLQPKNGANVVALCYASGETWNVPNGNISRVSDHCQQPSVKDLDCSDKKNGCLGNGDPRGPIADSNTPYIISPYDTDLIDDRPPISWHAVPGITNYSVRVMDITGSGLNWERSAIALPKSAENEIRWEYPRDVQALEPGHEYKLTVEVNTESPQNRTVPGEATFAILKPEDIKQLQDTINTIDKLNIPKEEKYLQDLYSVYKRKNLISEIIKILESLVKDGSQTPQVYRKLGDIYLKQGLLELAQPRYETAVRLARATQDTKELEAAQTGLEQVIAGLKKPDAAQ